MLNKSVADVTVGQLGEMFPLQFAKPQKKADPHSPELHSGKNLGGVHSPLLELRLLIFSLQKVSQAAK